MENNNQTITPQQFFPNNPISTLPKKSNKKVLIAVLTIIIIVILGWLLWKYEIIKNVPKKQTILNQENWKTYTNSQYGFEIKYPASVFVFDEVNLTLVHKLKNFHSYSMKDGSDLGLATDISLAFKPGSATCDYLENVLKIQSLGVLFTIGNIRGISYEMGAEGEGIVDYCIKNEQGSNIFAVERKFLSESYSINLIKQSDYIPSVEQTKLSNQVLSSFKFINAETMVVKVYFAPKGSEQLECNDVVATERMITKTEKVATMALEELLKGPTAEEKAKGYITVVPVGSKLNSLVIVNGEARADFNAVTESGGGSCGMGVRTAQIYQTLLQFPTIKTIKLSIDGQDNPSLIFQP